MMIAFIQKKFKYSELLYIITWREIVIKYKQSIMGFLWAILMPVLIISAGILVKYAFAMLSGKAMSIDSILSVTVKALPWSLFVSSIRFASNSLIANTNLVTKIKFPKLIFPISAVLSQLFDFFIASVVLTIFLIIMPVEFTTTILFVPVLLIIFLLLIVSLAVLFSAANLFFRDVKYIVEVILTFAIFFTPVFYEVEMFKKWSTILMLNPVAPLLEGINSCIVRGELPGAGWIIYSASISCCLFMFSFFLFKKLEPIFAESI